MHSSSKCLCERHLISPNIVDTAKHFWRTSQIQHLSLVKSSARRCANTVSNKFACEVLTSGICLHSSSQRLWTCIRASIQLVKISNFHYFTHLSRWLRMCFWNVTSYVCELSTLILLKICDVSESYSRWRLSGIIEHNLRETLKSSTNSWRSPIRAWSLSMSQRWWDKRTHDIG